MMILMMIMLVFYIKCVNEFMHGCLVVHVYGDVYMWDAIFRHSVDRR